MIFIRSTGIIQDIKSDNIININQSTVQVLNALSFGNSFVSLSGTVHAECLVVVCGMAASFVDAPKRTARVDLA